MKKINVFTLFITIIITLAAIIGNAKPVQADEPQDTARLDSLENMNLESYVAENERVYELGQHILSQRASSIAALSSFPRMKQYDSQWANVIMKTANLPIGTSGCCLTSFTMIQKYYGGTHTPADVNTTLGDYACPFWYYIAAEKYNYTISTFVAEQTSYSDTLNYVVGAISEKRPVMIGMSRSDGKTHYVVAFGYAYENILISDPAGEDVSTAYLAEYTDNGYIIDRIIIYNN